MCETYQCSAELSHSRPSIRVWGIRKKEIMCLDNYPRGAVRIFFVLQETKRDFRPPLRLTSRGLFWVLDLGFFPEKKTRELK